jgi:DNA-binding response OmpR family regulator
MTQLLAGRHVLIVEDNALIAETIEDVLLDDGAEAVVHASSVAVALAAIDRQAFDFGLLDVSLVREESWPVAARLRELAIPYVIMTGHGETAQHELVTHLLPKPYDMHQLRSAIGTLLATPSGRTDSVPRTERSS